MLKMIRIELVDLADDVTFSIKIIKTIFIPDLFDIIVVLWRVFVLFYHRTQIYGLCYYVIFKR